MSLTHERWLSLAITALRGLSTGQTLKYFEMNVGFAGKRASISRVLQDQGVITENQRAMGFFVVVCSNLRECTELTTKSALRDGRRNVFASPCGHVLVHCSTQPDTAGVSDLRYEPFWNHWRDAVVARSDSPYFTKDDAKFICAMTSLGPPRFTIDPNA